MLIALPPVFLGRIYLRRMSFIYKHLQHSEVYSGQDLEPPLSQRTRLGLPPLHIWEPAPS